MPPVATPIAGSQSWSTRAAAYLLAAVAIALALLAGPQVAAAPVVEGSLSDVTTITCKIEEGGATTCAVSQGKAAICALRKGQDIQRSYRVYDYLDQPPGCSLGLDYWRAHAPDGAAPYDDTWEKLGPDGPRSAFYGSSLTYLDMLGPETSGEDPYRTLARAYAATELNRLNGATLPEPVQGAQDEASVMLLGSPGGTFDPDMAERSRALAAVLTEYLEGGSGPGSCAAMTQPLGPEDVGKLLAGLESGDTGTILRLEENKEEPGEGLLNIGPLTAEDQFILADEAFAVEGVRKGEFTQSANDCVVANAGEEVSVLVGGLPDDPTAISALMQQLARNLQVMIALNTDTAPPTPGAGPAGPPTGPSGVPGGSSSGSVGGGFGGFPTGVLPPIGGSGGSDLIPVPDLIGLTEGQARGRLAAAQLSVGSVTTVSSLSPSGGGLIATAYAQTPCEVPVVVTQSPSAGTLVAPGSPVSFGLCSSSQPLPEPSSLLMIFVALAALGLLLWRGGRLGASGAAILLILGTLGCDNRAAEQRIALAKQFIDAGRPNGAVIELKKAIQAEPGSAEARYLLGQAYLGLDRLADAEKEFSRAAALRPEDPQVALALGRTWMRQGQSARLLAELHPAAAWPDAQESLAWSLRGEAQLASGAPEDAMGSFQTASALGPDRIEPLIGLYRTATKLEREEAARGALERALALAPEDPTLLGLAGRRAFLAKDYAGAESAWRRQLAGGPENVTARLDLAQALLAQGREEAAIEVERALAGTPGHPDAHYLLAVIRVRQGDLAGAGEHACEALRSRPMHTPSRALAALAAAQLENWTETKAHLDELRVLQPDHPLIAELDGRLLLAEAVARESPARPAPLDRDLALFRLDPLEAPAAERLLESLGSGGSQARLAYDRMAREASPSWTARGGALAEHRTGRPLRARLLLQDWLRDHPRDAETRGVLSDLLLLEGDVDAAIPHLRMLAAQAPRDSGVLNDLAWALSRKGELPEARILSQRAIALAPHDPRVMDTRGLILLQDGDAEGAVAVLARAAGSEGAPPETSIHLAQALIRAGDGDAAKDVLVRTLEADEAAGQHRAAEILLLTLQP